MIFLNYDFWGDNSALDYVAPKNDEITSVSIQNAVYDELYLSSNTNYDMTNIPQEWDYETIFHAVFNENLQAGNVDYTLDEVAFLRLKRREIGTYNWITLAEFPTNNLGDFDITYVDKYADAGDNVEYALVAVSDSRIEGSSNTMTAESNFDGIMIAERDTAYRAFLYDYTPTERNQLTSVVTTLYNKYPFVVKNSNANYTSGTIHAAFLPVDSCTITHDYIQDTAFREAFTDFLTNGHPKILKLDDGRSWIVNVIDNVSHSDNGGILYTDFSFVETADAKDNQSLYDADLTESISTVDYYSNDVPASVAFLNI